MQVVSAFESKFSKLSVVFCISSSHLIFLECILMITIKIPALFNSVNDPNFLIKSEFILFTFYSRAYSLQALITHSDPYILVLGKGVMGNGFKGV